MNINRDNKEIYILLFFILISFFLPLSLAPLFDLDEGAFSEATREMLINHDYITTYLNGALRFDKPILIYWLQLISVKTFGLNEFALRLPSAIAGAIWAWAIYFYTKELFNKKTAFWATLFMISSLQITIIAKASIADSLLNMFIALSMFNLYLFFQKREDKYIYFTFLFIALGTLTKGPVAIMIPFIVSLIFFILKGEFKLWLRMIFNPIGIVIFAIVALPWYIAEYQAQGKAFIDGFFFKHNLSRFSSAMEKHSGSIFYFVPVLIIGVMPFTYFILKALKNFKIHLKSDISLYLLIWFSFVFIFFSLSGTKLPHYVIYGYTPIFILGALYIDNFNRKWLIYPLIIFLTLLLFLPDIATLLQNQIRDKLAVALIQNAYDTFDIWYRISLIFLILFAIYIYKKAKENKTFLISIALIMTIMVNYIVIPTYGKLMQQPIKEAGLLAKEKRYKNIVMYRVNTPSFNVYYENLVKKSKKVKKGDIVFTKVTKLKDFKKYKTIYKKNGFALIQIEEIK